MKIVIDIPDDKYRQIKDFPSAFDSSICKAIRNGTVLPKGHGDLIDRDKLEKDTEWSEYEDEFISYSHRQIFNEPVVIPADKGMCYNCQYKTDSCQEGLHCIRDSEG